MRDEAYHLGELKVALDPTHPSHSLPPPLPRDKKVLDVGCGAGQTLIAAYPERVSFGLDIDVDALKFGRTLTEHVRFACGTANALPFRSGDFDMVVARVSLIYSNLPVALSEIRRVLAPGGEVWITVHPFSLAWKHAQARNWKGWIFFGYIVVNSLFFHLMGKQFAFPFLRRYESFQTERGMRRSLARNGFENISIEKSKERFLVTARVAGI